MTERYSIASSPYRSSSRSSGVAGTWHRGGEVLMDEPCVICGGKRYLLNQTYGEADIPEGWIPVQACDECSPHLLDEAAVLIAAQDQGTEFEFFEPEYGPDDEVPVMELHGDWAIRVGT